MTYSPYPKSSYLEEYNAVMHLHAVMNSACSDGLCLVVNVTSIKPDRYIDRACVLAAGEHDFIKQDSYIVYKWARQLRAAHLSKMVSSGVFLSKEDWKPAVFGRICTGIFASLDAPRWIAKYARSVGIPNS